MNAPGSPARGAQRLARLLLLGIFVGLAALLALNGRLIVSWITTTKIPINRVEQRSGPFARYAIRITGWHTVRRWTDPPVLHGRSVEYWVHNGRKVKREETLYREGRRVRTTLWTLFGTVQRQIDYEDENGNLTRIGKTRRRPPWWWGVEDQKEPIYTGSRSGG